MDVTTFQALAQQQQQQQMGGMRPGFPFPGVMGQQPSAYCNPNRMRATPHALAGSKCRGLIPTACRRFCPCQSFASQHTPQYNLHTLRPSPARPLLLHSRALCRRYRDASAAIQNQASMMRPSMPGSRKQRPLCTCLVFPSYSSPPPLQASLQCSPPAPTWLQCLRVSNLASTISWAIPICQ
jgi:hypothetical protein